MRRSSELLSESTLVNTSNVVLKAKIAMRLLDAPLPMPERARQAVYSSEGRYQGWPAIPGSKKLEGENLVGKCHRRDDDVANRSGLPRAAPGSSKEVALSTGERASRRIYTPHSLRSTTATLLPPPGWTSPKLNSFSVIGTSRPLKSTTRGAAQPRRVRVTTFRSDVAFHEFITGRDSRSESLRNSHLPHQIMCPSRTKK